MKKKISGLISLLMITSILLMGCASSNDESSSKTAQLKLKIETSNAVNQNRLNQSNPVVLQVFELKNASAFEQLDYFSLLNKDRDLLGEDLVSKSEYILKPEEQRVVIKNLSKDTQAIGFIAGFQNLPRSTWRKIYHINRSNRLGPKWMSFKQKIKLSVDLFDDYLVLYDDEMNQY